MAKILIVDDEPEAVRLLSAFLRQEGHRSLGAHDGKAGLNALASQPDFIFCDYHMPGMNGYEFTRTLKTNPAYQVYASTPVVGIGEFPADKLEYLAACFEKPFDPRLLVEWIEAHCPRQK